MTRLSIGAEPTGRIPSEPSGLGRLGLSPEQLDALARQGFLAQEDRGGKKPVYKLRFRLHGRQIVKYVGTDPGFVAEVRQDLLALQQAHRQARELQKLMHEANLVLRSSKCSLQPALAAAGWRFHGYAVRRARARREPNQGQ